MPTRLKLLEISYFNRTEERNVIQGIPDQEGRIQNVKLLFAVHFHSRILIDSN